MKYNWTEKKLSEIADINPRESIGKGIVAKKVPMDTGMSGEWENCKSIYFK